ncbi:hypothetical protein GOP47_0018136 [Adiantum capillus-veneris]|uniref:Uncharacterized protein n=1 Tax=Adiantum capillus-veneris TaxID=13818 RepID=A0A9D4UHN8_ADICA|nr:hypothetical protein GOP47_0018136 [Adiantum capillus-veneris]
MTRHLKAAFPCPLQATLSSAHKLIFPAGSPSKQRPRSATPSHISQAVPILLVIPSIAGHHSLYIRSSPLLAVSSFQLAATPCSDALALGCILPLQGPRDLLFTCLPSGTIGGSSVATPHAVSFSPPAV